MSKESEKKLIADKVAKVREVVNGVNNNDIIMVLHSFDLNVEKTIQAFCDNGAAHILDDWVRTGASATGNKNNKNKKKKAKNANSANVAPEVTASVASSLRNGAPSQVQESANQVSSTVQIPAPQTATAAKKKPATKDGSKSTDAISTAFKKLHTALDQRERELQAGQSVGSLDTSELLRLIATFAQYQNLSNGGIDSIHAQKSAPKEETYVNSAPPSSTAPIKHATSQSSISSSVGADSGVNLSPTHKEEKKKETKTQMDGIVVSSQGLDADQLAALQQTLHLQLAARGLNPSVLTSSENIVRKTRKDGNNKKNGKSQHNAPKLSIL